MKRLSACEAKVQLSRLLQETERGESFAITKHGRPVAMLVPADKAEPPQLPVDEAIAGLRAFRRRHALDRVSIRDLIIDGRRP